jgi:hypothetical protein
MTPENKIAAYQKNYGMPANRVPERGTINLISYAYNNITDSVLINNRISIKKYLALPSFGRKSFSSLCISSLKEGEFHDNFIFLLYKL